LQTPKNIFPSYPRHFVDNCPEISRLMASYPDWVRCMASPG
jgi:hypothetical protein